MEQNLFVLSWAAVAIAVVHTLFGPDHYIPFVAMSRVGHWSLRKTMVVTFLCGLGHVGSSIALGTIGIALGVVLERLTVIEGLRGNVAGWLLIGFGIAYLTWGIVQAVRGKAHTHTHVHSDGTIHSHEHTHRTAREPHGDHMHVHGTEPSPPRHDHEHTGSSARLTPWVLFTIFIFGPCEPLIPLLMYPAWQRAWWGVVLVTLLFSVATIATMMTVVVALLHGARFVQLGWLHQYSHALAGAVILACGLAINFGL